MVSIDKNAVTGLSLRFALGYRPALDGLRGISILAVMFVHGGLFWMGRGGFLGVDIFFVLSGFLITSLLLEEHSQAGTISFRNFYIRRGLRLLPALVLVVASCMLAVMIFPPASGTAPAIRSILIALFYLSNWTPGTVYGPLFHTWSLGIEEQFYIVWPILLFGLLWFKAGNRSLLIFLLLAISAVAINRAMLWTTLSGFEAKQYAVYTRLDARADSLLVGCIAGILMSRNLIPQKAWLFTIIEYLSMVSALCLAGLLFALPSNARFLYFGGFTAIAAMVAVIIINLFTSPLKISSLLLEIPLLRWFGRLSYGLYLWHLPIYRAYEGYVPPFPFKSYTLGIGLPFILKFLASVAVAAVSFYVIERPALRLKKRFTSTRSKTIASTKPPMIVSTAKPQDVVDVGT